MRFLLILLLFCCYSTSSYAVPSAEDYAIELDEEIPDLADLADKFHYQNSDYRRNFSFRWDMPKTFDKEFKNIYKTLAEDERHLSSKTEDYIYMMLKKLPKEFYPYIGPYLHTLPQLTGRVLDMPGIKETKNKLPERIAEKFKNIEYLEYLSPELYIFLMPEMTGEGSLSYEYPQLAEPEYRTLRRTSINPEFMQKIVEQTPLADFADSSKKEKSAGTRHYIFDENTPLSGADVEAFSNTLGDLHDFHLANRINFIKVGTLMSFWEEENGAEQDFYFYKQMANPCAAMVRNIKWANKSFEFQKIIGKNGFGINDWALVCDRTLKAYRRANISLAMVMVIRGLQNGVLIKYYEMSGVDKEDMPILEANLGAAREMYNASREDVETVKPYMNRIHKTLPENNSYFLGSPLLIP